MSHTHPKEGPRVTTIVIFDDQPESIEELRGLLSEAIPESVPHRVLEARSLPELRSILNSDTQIDILLADIIMPEGQPSGIQVVQRLFPPESGTQIIYVSGYINQAPEVYVTDHLYFLLKPVEVAKLDHALGKALSALAHRQPTMLRIKVGHKLQLVNTARISHLESDLHKVRVHTRSQTFETYTKLDSLMPQLPSSFTRIHRSYAVNLAYVASLGENELRLHDGTILPISRRRAKAVQHDLMAYIAGRQ